MKTLFWVVGFSLIFTGCYTMLYPPPEAASYGYGANEVLTIPDSLSGRGITIINQNQMILDRYYEDPFYRRDGFFGGYGCWDPYYYDHRGYNHDHRWHRGRYYDPGTPPGPVTPEPKKPRREKDQRRSENPPVDAPNQSATAFFAPAPTVTTAAIAPAQPQEPAEVNNPTDASALKPDGGNKEAEKPREDKIAVKSDPPADSLKAKTPNDSAKDQKAEKKARRGGVRGK